VSGNYIESGIDQDRNVKAEALNATRYLTKLLVGVDGGLRGSSRRAPIGRYSTESVREEALKLHFLVPHALLDWRAIVPSFQIDYDSM
jgi:hypothetical protein